MRLGDLLEIVGIAALAVAAYLAAGVAAGLAVLAAGVIYLAQCYGHIPLPGWGRRREQALRDVIAPLGIDQFLRQVAMQDPSKAEALRELAAVSER